MMQIPPFEATPQKPKIVDGGALPLQPLPPVSEVTMSQLAENYQTIVRTSAIYYPVAYKFVRELGRGRQGRVYLALRQGARGCITEHAIKLLDPSIYRGAEEYWTDMGRIAYQISHLHQLMSPNLVSRYAYEETYGIGYIQLEAIDGLDLRRLLSRECLELAKKRSSQREWTKFTKTVFRFEGDKILFQPGVAVYILRGVLRGLERLHGANFLHCDIKPGNIMIDRLGNVKVVDFGRAVVAGERLSFLLGSPMYMAPEIHRREMASQQSDFYSLGLVALEMLLGERLTPNEDVSEEELLRTKMNLPARLGDMLPAYVKANKYLVSILHRFIEPDPMKRYISAKDADVGEQGLRIIDKQLVHAGLDSEYARDLADYLAKLVNENTQRIDVELLR